MPNCPICSESQYQASNSMGAVSHNCARCGIFILSADLSSETGLIAQNRSILSHRMRRAQRTDKRPIFVSCSWTRNSDMQILFDEAPVSLPSRLPSPQEQFEQLILWVGDRQESPAAYCRIDSEALSALSAWLGAVITVRPGDGLTWLASCDEGKAHFDTGPALSQTLLRLKMRGWERYEDLKSKQVSSRLAFMAMQFDRELHNVVDICFKPAVSRAGFELRLLTDEQAAGLIDDQLRVALRNSRFTIADLTHGNKGAYWEAGFAEGLGRPVIYTCRKEDWDKRDESGRTNVHFDTNHLVTIIWEPDQLEDAARRLTATIRATLPTEARMSD
jgi:hypothetical protein